MDRTSATNLVKKELGGGFAFKPQKETSTHFVFMCESGDPDAIPNKFAVAVNKATGKMGSSIMSFDDAIKKA